MRRTFRMSIMGGMRTYRSFNVSLKKKAHICSTLSTIARTKSGVKVCISMLKIWKCWTSLIISK